MKEPRKYIRYIQAFKAHKGILRFNQAREKNIFPAHLSAMKQAGVIEQLGRGLYRLTSLPPLSNPDLVTVAAKIPQGVICLISALSFHDITTQVPHAVDVALKSGSERPNLEHPPTQFYWFSEISFKGGVESHEIDGVPIKIFSPEKTIVDCFKFRNRVGIDVAIEALKLYREKKRFSADTLLKYAKICRMERVMRPYLETIL